MEPVFQRLGDVTIQRLEKPKEKPPAQIEITALDKEVSEEELSGAEEYSADETGGSKRFADVAGPSNKRFKLNPADVTLEKKHCDDSNLQNFSDNELSEYYSESDVESDGEDDSPVKEEKEDSSFSEKLSDEPPNQNDSTTTTAAAAATTTSATTGGGGDTEDYDYDIKQKLKEMGEISFETVKKSDVKPKKVERVSENEVVVTPAKKSSDDDALGERKGGMLRRNIREVMDETKLDEATLAAQRQEMERLQRVNEQQRFLREVQRQVAQERMQSKVLSLLQGSSSSSKPGTSGTRIGNTVLVKLPNGQTKPMTKLPKRPFELVKINKGATSTMGAPKTSCNIVSIKKPQANLTPSVSIAPVAKKPPPVTAMPPSDSESEPEDAMEPPEEKITVKKEPVPTIDISSDDDCIVVSETETDATPDEPDEDPSNSGMHTNDNFNQPDEHGRVVVNIGHPDGEPDIYLAPQIARIIKPHQIGGLRFLFDNVIESIGRFEHSTGFGCILAHSMGLGKTLQIVSFSDIFLRHTPAKTILCIMPINTLQNWMAEYNMWLPSEEAAAASPLHTHGEVRPRTFNLHVLNDSHKTLVARAKVIRAWKQDGGVLLIGYEQYRLLSMRKHPKSRRKRILQVEPKDDDKNKALFDEVYDALVKPGPDLVICDEGHRIKNSHASISQALKQMRTKRRIVLTGYPLQNNLMEYWCMVDFVRPNYLGTKTEFCNMFERPIQNGQCIDSTEADIKLMRYRAHVLHSLLVGFVQRRSHTVLQKALPQKEEYVLLVRMSQFQRKLYETFMNEVVRAQTVPNPLKAFAVCCKIWNHPDVLYYFLKKRAGGEAVDIDLEEVASTTTSNPETLAKAKRGPKKKSAKSKETAKQAVASSSNSNSSNSNGALHQTSSVASNPFDDSDKSEVNYKPPPYPNFNQHAYQQNYNSPNSYQNYPQHNYWGGENFNSQSDFYNCPPAYSQNFAGGNTWIKSEDGKPVITNNVVPSPVKNDSDSCSSDCKPKINIISDIKLNNVVMPKFTSPEKKINILSDIKLEPKKEELDEKPLIAVKEEPIKTETPDDDVKVLSEAAGSKPVPKELKEDTGIPYDWAIDLLKDYVPGRIENSAKMEILFCMIRESIALGDRLLVFSQSLITLDLIEQFLQMNVVPGETQKWAKNTNYYRLDGSTSALEREKLINEFNSNPKIHLFLVSTRAGSLGINLVGANRVVVLDASWNPCHDTQAVCRVYRYGQRKQCFVYRLVVDNCLEKKIYDRQINKQGMSDRVVDECNPDAHLTMKDVSTLCWDDNKEDGEEKDWSHTKDNYSDIVLQKVLETLSRRLNKEPFQHESLLVDRKEKQLSQQEKRLAKKGYEREKQASRQPAYNLATMSRGRPVASVRPMQQGVERPSRWIPAEHWQRQGMTAQEMRLPLDVVIPTNQGDKGNIVLKSGQKVLILKSPKGVYMQLESGKIVAIKTAIKVRGKAEDNDPNKMLKPTLPPSIKNNPALSLLPPKRMVKPFTPGLTKLNVRSIRQPVPNLVSRIHSVTRKMQMAKGKPYQVGSEIAKAVNSKNNQHSLPMSSSDEEGLSGEGNLMSMFSDEERMDNMGDDGMLGREPMGNAVRKHQVSHQQQQQQSQINRRMMAAGSGSRGYSENFGGKHLQNKHVSPLEQLEQSASSLMDHAQQGFQDSLDTLTDAYQDEEKFDDQSAEENADSLHDSLSDDVQELPQEPTATLQNHTGKPENIPQTDYTYNNYYNYNPYPPPPHPGHPQGYAPGYPPQQPHPYDMGGYAAAPPPPQQAPPPPQYNYMYPPQGYTPYAQPGYDYNHPPHPPPPVYAGYNPYQQQYPAQGHYPPPPPPAPGYPPDYQYPPPPQQAPPPAGTPYYPTS